MATRSNPPRRHAIRGHDHETPPLELQLAHGFPSDNAMVNVVDLPGSTVPAGFLLPPLALSKILDTWRPPRGVHQRLNR